MKIAFTQFKIFETLVIFFAGRRALETFVFLNMRTGKIQKIFQ